MEKIKSFIQSDFGKDIFVVIIVVLVALSSFLLGRLSIVSKSSGVKVEYPTGMQSTKIIGDGGQTASVVEAVKRTGNYFASNRGTKYYGVGCEAGKSLKKENRVYFNTKAEAEKAGYELSSSCR